MSDNKELDAALLKLETKHRTEDFLKKLGASDEAAALIAANPDQAKKFTYDGVNLKFGGSDLAAVDDPAAKAFFHDGPFKALFVIPEKPGSDGHSQVDPALLASARAGNKTAQSRILRDSLNGDLKALDRVLADKGDGDGDGAANGGGTNGAGDSAHKTNPFTKLRDRNGKIDPAVAKNVESMIRAMGTKKVAAIAAAVNMTITGLPLTR